MTTATERAPAAIDPFRIQIPDAQLEDLRRRLHATRWPDHETVDDWTQGVPLSYVKEVCGNWGALDACTAPANNLSACIGSPRSESR